MARKPYNNPALEQAAGAMESEIRRALASIERELSRRLRELRLDGELIERDVFNSTLVRNQLQNMSALLQEHGFSDVARKASEQVKALAQSILDESDGMGLPASFTKQTKGTLEDMLWGVQKSITQSRSLIAADLQQVLLRSTLGTQRLGDLVQSIASRLDVRVHQAMAEVSGAIADFHTTARVAHFGEDVEWWTLAGPLDERTRPWCSATVGRRFTLPMLDATATDHGRKHPLPPSASRGGYNCRHELVPVVAELKSYPILEVEG